MTAELNYLPIPVYKNKPWVVFLIATGIWFVSLTVATTVFGYLILESVLGSSVLNPWQTLLLMTALCLLVSPMIGLMAFYQARTSNQLLAAARSLLPKTIKRRYLVDITPEQAEGLASGKVVEIDLPNNKGNNPVKLKLKNSHYSVPELENAVTHIPLSTSEKELRDHLIDKYGIRFTAKQLDALRAGLVLPYSLHGTTSELLLELKHGEAILLRRTTQELTPIAQAND